MASCEAQELRYSRWTSWTSPEPSGWTVWSPPDGGLIIYTSTIIIDRKQSAVLVDLFHMFTQLISSFSSVGSVCV